MAPPRNAARGVARRGPMLTSRKGIRWTLGFLTARLCFGTVAEERLAYGETKTKGAMAPDGHCQEEAAPIY
jgi:hypothetical protein